MPVPSTMMGFRLTMVLMPCGRVASALADMRYVQPMAMTRSMRGSAAIRPSSSAAM